MIARFSRSIWPLLTGNVVGAAVGGLFFVAASRGLDLEELGLYGVAISAQFVLGGVLGTGLGVATIRLAADSFEGHDPSGAAGVVALAVAMVIAVGSGLVSIVAGLAAAGVPPLWIGGRASVLVVLWAVARSILDCLRAGLLARRSNGRAGALTVITAVTGLAALGTLVARGPLTVERLLCAHVLGLGAGALVGALLLRPLFREGVRATRQRLGELLRYAAWPGLSEGTRLLQGSLGPFLLVAGAGSAQAGLFSLGRYPAIVFDVVALSLYQVWLPEATRTAANHRALLSRQTRVAAWVGASMVTLALATRPLLPWLAENFAAAGWLFVLSTIDVSLFLLTRPIESACHGLRRPRLELWLRTARLPALVALALLLVPGYGALGMAWAHVATALGGVLLAVWTIRRALAAAPQDQPSRRATLL